MSWRPVDHQCGARRDAASWENARSARRAPAPRIGGFVGDLRPPASFVGNERQHIYVPCQHDVTSAMTRARREENYRPTIAPTIKLQPARLSSSWSTGVCLASLAGAVAHRGNDQSPPVTRISLPESYAETKMACCAATFCLDFRREKSKSRRY